MRLNVQIIKSFQLLHSNFILFLTLITCKMLLLFLIISVNRRAQKHNT